MEELKRLDMLTCAVESKGIDITGTYNDWLTVAFACASVGEAGRSYFHRLSRFYKNYSPANTDQQFTACLKRPPSTSGLAPLFCLCGKFGIIVKDIVRRSSPVSATSVNVVNNIASQESPQNVPTSPPLASFESLVKEASQMLEYITLLSPPPLIEAITVSALVGISSLLPSLRLFYGGREEYCHLYCCLIAPAGTGKGSVNEIRRLLNQTHKKKREEYKARKEEYKNALAIQKKNESVDVQPPPQLVHFIPADVSKAALIKLISDNNGGGIIWESELDTLTAATASEFGHFSDFLRKNFHSEHVSAYRKGEDKLQEIARPHTAIMLTGTPDQMKQLFKSVENGLYSRFLFWLMPANDDFDNPFNFSPRSEEWKFVEDWITLLPDYFPNPVVPVIVPKEIQTQHIKIYTTMSKQYASLIGSDSLALIRRLSLIHLRLASVISALKTVELGVPNVTTLEITPAAWELAKRIAETGAEAAAALMQQLPQQTGEAGKASLRRHRVFSMLPPAFKLENFPPDVSRATAYRYVDLWQKMGLINHDRQKGMYFKTGEVGNGIV